MDKLQALTDVQAQAQVPIHALNQHSRKHTSGRSPRLRGVNLEFKLKLEKNAPENTLQGAALTEGNEWAAGQLNI